MMRILTALLFFSALYGCSVNHPKQTLDPSLISQDSFGEYELYADLVKQSGKWQFTNINEYLGEVLLNNMTLHSLANTDYKRCHRGIFGLTSGNCDEIDSDWLSYKPMARNLILFPISWALAPVGMPISWANGDFTDIDVFFFPVQVIPTFDNEALKQALDQASKSENGQDIIEEIGNLYTEVKELSKSTKYDYPEANAEIFTKLVSEFKKNQKNAVKAYLKENLALVIQDRSGLFNRKAPNPNYLTKATISIPELDKEFLYPDIVPIANTKSVIGSLLPADNLEQLRSRLLRAQDKLADIHQSNNSTYHKNLKLLEQTNAINEQSFAQFKKESLNNRFTINWEVSPSAKFLLKDMDFEIELPPELVLSQSELDIEPYLKLTINNIDFKPTLPNDYQNEDSYLKTALSTDHIVFMSKSDNSIELDSIRLQINNNLVSTQLKKALEPGETYKHFLTKGDLSTFAPLFSGLTKAKANNTNLQTKLTIDYKNGSSSYTLGGQTETTTLAVLLQD